MQHIGTSDFCPDRDMYRNYQRFLCILKPVIGFSQRLIKFARDRDDDRHSDNVGDGYEETRERTVSSAHVLSRRKVTKL